MTRLFKCISRLLLFILSCSLLSSCYLHFQGQKNLAPPLHKLYVQTPDPYGLLERNLKQLLKASHVTLTATPQEATTILNVLQDTNSSHLLSVSGTQQTRQYSLVVTVLFEVTDNKGAVLVPAQPLSESRTITEQSNQILGSSNEANLFYQQMRRSLAHAIINRLASKQVTNLLVKPANSKRP